jgi:hypothetical protein
METAAPGQARRQSLIRGRPPSRQICGRPFRAGTVLGGEGTIGVPLRSRARRFDDDNAGPDVHVCACLVPLVVDEHGTPPKLHHNC